MSLETLAQHLDSIGACQSARDWSAGMTAAEAWQKCENPTWLLWWAGTVAGLMCRERIVAHMAARNDDDSLSYPFGTIEAKRIWWINRCNAIRAKLEQPWSEPVKVHIGEEHVA